MDGWLESVYVHAYRIEPLHLSTIYSTLGIPVCGGFNQRVDQQCVKSDEIV